MTYAVPAVGVRVCPLTTKGEVVLRTTVEPSTSTLVPEGVNENVVPDIVIAEPPGATFCPAMMYAPAVGMKVCPPIKRGEVARAAVLRATVEPSTTTLVPEGGSENVVPDIVTAEPPGARVCPPIIYAAAVVGVMVCPPLTKGEVPSTAAPNATVEPSIIALASEAASDIVVPNTVMGVEPGARVLPPMIKAPAELAVTVLEPMVRTAAVARVGWPVCPPITKGAVPCTVVPRATVEPSMTALMADGASEMAIPETVIGADPSTRVLPPIAKALAELAVMASEPRVRTVAVVAFGRVIPPTTRFEPPACTPLVTEAPAAATPTP